MDIGSLDWALPEMFCDHRDFSFIVLRKHVISKKHIQEEQL